MLMMIVYETRRKIIKVLEDRYVRISFRLFLFIMVVYLIVIIWKWNQLPPQIPLFYSLPRSNDMLGTNKQILILPIFSFICYLINFIFSIFIYEKERLVAVFLHIAGTSFSLLLLISLIKIVFLVT